MEIPRYWRLSGMMLDPNRHGYRPNCVPENRLLMNTQQSKATDESGLSSKPVATGGTVVYRAKVTDSV